MGKLIDRLRQKFAKGHPVGSLRICMNTRSHFRFQVVQVVTDPVVWRPGGRFPDWMVHQLNGWLGSMGGPRLIPGTVIMLAEPPVTPTGALSQIVALGKLSEGCPVELLVKPEEDPLDGAEEEISKPIAPRETKQTTGADQ